MPHALSILPRSCWNVLLPQIGHIGRLRSPSGWSSVIRSSFLSWRYPGHDADRRRVLAGEPEPAVGTFDDELVERRVEPPLLLAAVGDPQLAAEEALELRAAREAARLAARSS